MKKGYEHWDNVWENQIYVSDYILRWYAYLRELSKSFRPEKKRILEVGCGPGGGISIFAKDGHESFGVDISPIAIEQAREKYKEVKFLCEDLFDMSLEKESFDVIFHSGLIEHFKYPKNIEAINAMVKLLKPGGKLIMVVPNSLCLWYVAGKKILTILNKWPYGFEDSYTPLLFKRYISESEALSLESISGLQAFPMLASPTVELMPIRYRKLIAEFEKILPAKQYYSYAILVECIKKNL